MQISTSIPATVPFADQASQLFNAGSALRENIDGTIQAYAPSAELGMLQPHVSSQFIYGNSVRGYIRVTVDNVGIAADGTLAILILNSKPGWFSQIVLTPIRTSNPGYLDSVAVNGYNAAFPFTDAAWNDIAQVFDIISAAQSPVSQSFAYIYHILL